MKRDQIGGAHAATIVGFATRIVPFLLVVSHDKGNRATQIRLRRKVEHPWQTVDAAVNRTRTYITSHTL